MSKNLRMQDLHELLRMIQEVEGILEQAQRQMHALYFSDFWHYISSPEAQEIRNRYERDISQLQEIIQDNEKTAVFLQLCLKAYLELFSMAAAPPSVSLNLGKAQKTAQKTAEPSRDLVSDTAGHSSPTADTQKLCAASRPVDVPFSASPALSVKTVQFSAVAPQRFEKGSYTMVDVVMYEESYRHRVEELLAQSALPMQETRSGMFQAEQNTTVRICLTSPNLPIEDGEEQQLWTGGYLDFRFAVLLPETYTKHQILFIATVFINDVIATRLKFIAACSAPHRQNTVIERQDILSAFVSYASQDRSRVAAIIQGMKKVRPDLDIFFDIENLHSGDPWKDILYSEIAQRDVLFLCWSHFARRSQWVDAEWRYALEQKGISGIEPIPLESPDSCPPPQELALKHFNDKLLYIINP